MHNEDVVLSHVEPIQMELKYGGAFGSLLANKTTPTHLILVGTCDLRTL